MRLFLASDLSRNEHLLHGCMASVATSEMEMLTDPMYIAALALDLFISKKADKRHSAGNEFVCTV